MGKVVYGLIWLNTNRSIQRHKKCLNYATPIEALSGAIAGGM
jgi:hypothetical protein